MEIFLFFLMIVFASIYLLPILFESFLLSFPFIKPFFKIKNSIIFGLIGAIFSQQVEPFPISNVFLGMIAGSFIDYLLNDKA